MAKPNFRQNVAEEMLKLIEKGTAPWQKPWDPNKVRSTPFNPTSEKTYRGMNQFWLEMQGHEDPRWMTYKQAAAMGVQVKKGERATPIEYWKWTEQKPAFDDKGKPKLDEKGKQIYQIFKLDRPQTFRANVFNGEQIDGLAPFIAPALTFDPIVKAEQLLKESNVPIKHDQADRCFYQGGATDEIHMVPKEGFETAHDYYAVALHEVGHSTGHDSRLNRELGNIFGSEKYAVEELRAEMASYMLTTELGLGHNPERHAPYIKSWMKAIKGDKNILFQAARDAEKITEWVLNKDKRLEMAKGASLSKETQQQEKTEAKSLWQNSMSDAKKLFDKNNAKTQQEESSNAPVYEKPLPKIKQEKPSPTQQKDIAPNINEAPNLLKSTHKKTTGHTVYKPSFKYVIIDQDFKIHILPSLKEAEKFRDTQGHLYTRDDFLKMIASKGDFAFKDASGHLSEAMKLSELVEKIAPDRQFNGSTKTLFNRNPNLLFGGRRHSIDVDGLRFQSDKTQHTAEINSLIVSAYIEQEVLAGNADMLVLPAHYQEIIEMSEKLEQGPQQKQEHHRDDFTKDPAFEKGIPKMATQNDQKMEEKQKLPENPRFNKGAEVVLTNELDMFVRTTLNKPATLDEIESDAKRTGRKLFGINGISVEALREGIQQEKQQANEIDKSQDQMVEKSLGQEEVAQEKRIYLDVPFKEKEAAKQAGAKWDKVEKSWYTLEDTFNKSDELRQWATTRLYLDVPEKDFIEVEKTKAEFDPHVKAWFTTAKGDDPWYEGDMAKWVPDPLIKSGTVLSTFDDEALPNHINSDLNQLVKEDILYSQLDTYEHFDMIDNVEYYHFNHCIEYSQALEQASKEIEQSLGKAPVFEQAKATEQTPERQFLNVPFKEKDQAKKAGAKWDRKAKSWYAPEGADGLEKWQPENIKVTNQIDPIEEFSHALKDHGLMANKIEMDGKWHRCQVEGDKKGEKSGSYRGFLDGVPNAQIKNFKDGAEAHKWVATGAKISEEERILLTRQSELRKAERERERNAQHQKASKVAYARIMNAPEAKPDHPYLEKKGIKPFGLKLDEKTNVLLVPMQDAKGHIWSTQAITEKGDKRFMYNGRKEGLFHVIGELDNKKGKQQTIIIAEGYGTAATVHEATKKAVVVAFDSGNLTPVAKAVRAQNPEAKIVIAADNDHSKKINVGVTKAQEAALAVKGEVAIPQFTRTQKERGYTDFNDLGQDKGLAAVGKALKASKAKQQSMGT